MCGLKRTNRAEETGGLMDAWIHVWPSGLLSPRSLISFSRESACECVRSMFVIESNCSPERTPLLLCICGDMSRGIIPNMAEEFSMVLMWSVAIGADLHIHTFLLPPSVIRQIQTHANTSQNGLSNRWYILTITANKSLLPPVPCPSSWSQLLIAAAVSERLSA